VSIVDDILNRWSKNQGTKASSQKIQGQYPLQLNTKNAASGFIVSNRPGHTKVSEEKAMQIPAVSSAVHLISSAIAKLPIELYDIDDDGDAKKILKDDRLFLLNSEPNEVQTATSLKKRIVIDYLLYGGSYIYIKRVENRNKIKSLHRLPVDSMTIEKYELDGFINSIEFNIDRVENNLKLSDVACILKDSEDGFSPRGILDSGYKTLSTALNEIDYSGSILKNGSVPLAVLKTMGTLSEDALKRIKADWENLYTGGQNAGKTVLLENGLEYETVSLKPNELELTEAKKSGISDISRLFSIPESMINANANKYNSNEQNNIYFLQYTLEPILINIEKALNKSLLLESEKKNGLYFKFDTSAILMVTEKEKAEIAQVLSNTSAVKQNEIRKVLGLSKLDTDYMFLSQGKVFYNTETGKAFNPNLGVQFDPENPDETTIKSMQAQNNNNYSNDINEGGENVNES